MSLESSLVNFFMFLRYGNRGARKKYITNQVLTRNPAG
jgi:hypothetical protein